MAREARYTAQLSVLVEESLKERILAIDSAYSNVGQGDAIRVALEAGIAHAEAYFRGVGIRKVDTESASSTGEVSFSG